MDFLVYLFNLSLDESFSDEFNVISGKLGSGRDNSLNDGGLFYAGSYIYKALLDALSDQSFDFIHRRLFYNYSFGLFQFVEVIANTINQTEHSGLKVSHVAFKCVCSNFYSTEACNSFFVQFFLNGFDNSGFYYWFASSSQLSFNLSHQFGFDSVKLWQQVVSCDLALETIECSGKYHCSFVTSHHSGSAVGSIGIPFD